MTAPDSSKPTPLPTGGMLTAISDGTLDEAQLVAAIGRATLRPVEVRVASGDPAGRARNRALDGARGDYSVFVVEEQEPSSFLAHATLLLDQRLDVDFVTGWPDSVPERDGDEPRPCAPAALLARPWFVHVPTVFRVEAWRAVGGFDERWAGLEEVDFLLRLLAAGRRGLVVENPWLCGRPWSGSLDARAAEARETAKALFERHRATFEAHATAAIVGKERIFRRLVTAADTASNYRRALEAEQLELAAEAERWRTLLDGESG